MAISGRIPLGVAVILAQNEEDRNQRPPQQPTLACEPMSDGCSPQFSTLNPTTPLGELADELVKFGATRAR